MQQSTAQAYQMMYCPMQLRQSSGEHLANRHPPTRQATISRKIAFGDRSKVRNGAIIDSRELGALASALSAPDKVRMLEQGKMLEEIETLAQPIEKRLTNGMATVRDELRDLVGRLSEQDIAADATERPVASGDEKPSLGHGVGEKAQGNRARRRW